MGDSITSYVNSDKIQIFNKLVFPYIDMGSFLDPFIYSLFPNVHMFATDPTQFVNRAILSLTNESMDKINEYFVKKTP